MAITTFGVTAIAVQEHHFPQIAGFSLTSNPKSTTVTAMIDASAATLAGALRVEGINPAAITTDYPEAYAWCAETVRLGAAVRAARAMTGLNPELVKSWEKTLEERYEALDSHGHMALGDAPSPSEPSNGPRHHIDDFSLDTGDEEDISDAVPNFRRSDAL